MKIRKRHLAPLSAFIFFAFAQAQTKTESDSTADQYFYRTDRYQVVSKKGNPGGLMAATYRIVSEPEVVGAHFERAAELYEQGPSKASRIIEELDLEIMLNPASVSARVLKARTLKGTNRCKEALIVLDELDTITYANQMISGSAQLLRAECQYYEGEYSKAERTIDVFERFFPDSSENRRFVPWLKSQISLKLDPPNASK
ncbi:MAG: hypothetical protein EOP84_05650 [Verrucomicrobiaceae bacterium]|nr:MAG: hypothetical protein EOP84_05650 [Verrucomicrobiaceae bacterium]